ncbi:MAG: GtrA family protein [Spirochaetaceae bacterium]|jgi:putative flippase GtrA|nr:GtrA family protein [Spirochaetaceae bacterium]
MLFDRKLIKFIIVGAINTLVGSAIMFSLYNLAHLGYWFSSACNYVFTSILSFFLNKYFTFSVKEWSVFMVMAFIANIVIAYLLAYGIAKPLVTHILQGSAQKIRDNVAMLAGMCLFTGINYIGQRLVVFRRSNK